MNNITLSGTALDCHKDKSEAAYIIDLLTIECISDNLSREKSCTGSALLNFEQQSISLKQNKS